MNDNTPLFFWHDHRPYFLFAVNGSVVFVDADLYRRIIKEEFVRRGLEFKTCDEYALEWRQQCSIEDELRSQVNWKQVRFSPMGGTLGQVILHKHVGTLSFTDPFRVVNASQARLLLTSGASS